MSGRRIRVLVVEDSPVAREFLVHVLQADPRLEVVGTAADGVEALDLVRKSRPDVVTMDIHMPRMNGLEATQRIMQEHPVPIVVVSGTVDDQVAATFQALQAGALAFVPRPAGFGAATHAAEAAEVVKTVRLMSEVKVVRRWRKRGTSMSKVEGEGAALSAARELRLVAIGASTGGPPALLSLLSALSQDFAVPVVIVQHIAEGFLEGFVNWLAKASGFPVHLAAHGEALRPGRAFVAPDGCHMGIDDRGRIVLSRESPDHGLRPSVDYLLRSVLRVYGASAAGVLLTGMGKDGAAELRALKDCGAQTFVQDRASAVVYGMPGEALRLDAARHVLAPHEIAEALRNLVALGSAQKRRLQSTSAGRP